MSDKILSTDAAGLALSKVKRFNKFEIVYLAFLHGYTANPKYADALPEAIANMAYKGACAAIEKMAESRAGIYGLQDPEPEGLKQTEIPFSYSNVPNDVLCDRCKQRFGDHSAFESLCPFVDENGIVKGKFDSGTFRPLRIGPITKPI